MPESLTNLPGRDDIFDINETPVDHEWRSADGRVRLTMTEQLWLPIRALIQADPSYREFWAHQIVFTAMNIFNIATLDIMTSNGLRTAPAIQRNIDELFTAMKEHRKLTYQEIKSAEEEIVDIFSGAAVRHMKGEPSQITDQMDDLKGAAAYFALKGLLAHLDLWEHKKPQRTSSPQKRTPLPSQPDAREGMWIPSQHSILVSQGAKELKRRFIKHNHGRTDQPFDLSAPTTWRLLHRDALAELEKRGADGLPSEATAKNHFAPNSETFVRYFTTVLFVAQGFHQITDT